MAFLVSVSDARPKSQAPADIGKAHKAAKAAAKREQKAAKAAKKKEKSAAAKVR